MSASKAVIAKRTRRNQQSKRKAKERRQQPLLAMPDDRPLEPGVLTLRKRDSSSARCAISESQGEGESVKLR